MCNSLIQRAHFALANGGNAAAPNAELRKGVQPGSRSSKFTTVIRSQTTARITISSLSSRGMLRLPGWRVSMTMLPWGTRSHDACWCYVWSAAVRPCRGARLRLYVAL
jgi:hypothetical protein